MTIDITVEVWDMDLASSTETTLEAFLADNAHDPDFPAEATDNLSAHKQKGPSDIRALTTP